MHRIFSQTRINHSFSADSGLNAAEVEERRARYGVNDIVEVSTNRWYALAKNTLIDPMIWFLVGTSVLFAILGNYNQTIILLLATTPLIGMDAFLHWRTEASTQSLSSQLAVTASVIRNGSTLKLPALEIVPGDLIVVNSGDFFPADGVIVGGKDLQVEESTLTGESLPVTKQVTQLHVTDLDMMTIDDNHWGFAGTQLLTGEALLRVVYTGKETLYGEIVTSAIQTSQAITPLQKAIAKLVLFLIVISTLICIVLASIRYYQGFGFVDAILSAATLAVAALPDEFPVVFTFFLGVGVYRLARKKALVRRAVSVENIGRVTCICSDKTGTITEGRLQLVQVIPAEAIDKEILLNFSIMASRKNSGDPLDFAIHHHAESEYQLTTPKTLAVFPFTEKRKRETAIVLQNTNEYLVTTKGAPETILALSNLTHSEQEIWIERIKQLAGEGYKVIACAYLLLTSSSTPNTEPKTNYQFAGLLSFNDPPRKEVYAAVQACRESDIRILMITGDHPETARAIACQIGLGDNHPNVITASEAEMALQQNGYASLQMIDVIARAVPSQKLMFVQALQAMGNIVAVTGDGVNDVPALKAADIGIAMGGRGTQSAREVAAIVLLDDNFNSIVNAIAEGRQLFKNLKLSFKYLLMIHIPFVFSAAIIPLLGYPLLYYPIHIVWIELIIHPTCMLVFQDLPTQKKLEPEKKRIKVQFFYQRDWWGVVTVGIYTTLLVTLSYIWVLKTGGSVGYARGLALGLLGVTSAALVVGLSGFRTLVSRIIAIVTLASLVLCLQIPMLAHFLDIHALFLQDWIIILLSGVLTFWLTKI